MPRTEAGRMIEGKNGVVLTLQSRKTPIFNSHRRKTPAKISVYIPLNASLRSNQQMKFKAFLTQDGVNLLDKRFLPSLDKIGRTCHFYLTRDHAVFLHNLIGGDGVQSVAQFKKEVIFRDYRISSQNEDRIAFAIDVALLHRALRSAQAIQLQSQDDTAAIQIKLVKKLPAGSRNPAPFLTFETKGLRSAVVQDVPISKPFSRADVAQLQDALDASQDLPQASFGWALPGAFYENAQEEHFSVCFSTVRSNGRRFPPQENFALATGGPTSDKQPDFGSSPRSLAVAELGGPIKECWRAFDVVHNSVWRPPSSGFDLPYYSWIRVPKAQGTWNSRYNLLAYLFEWFLYHFSS
ncbi:hypothetical protein KSP40_PGU006723 [Platanthera guangdongensis]|uniref:Uncharacterized protein n=1 Tax=Platanthera guangdongensis TaxID=2320717 RepID=A0ABR2LPS0_9ASPA